MKRSAALAIALCLLFAACQAPAEAGKAVSPLPSESSVASNLESFPSDPPESGNLELPLIVSPGVKVKALLTYDREKEGVSFGPRCGNLQLFYRKTYDTDRKSLFGFDLETEEMLEFDLTLPDKTNVWAALGRDREFILFDGVRRRHFAWKNGQLQEYPEYVLPEPVKSRVTKHSYQDWPPESGHWQTCDPWETDFYWDALPEKDLLAWCQEDGVYLSASDSTGAYLAIPRSEVFHLPSLAKSKEIAPDFVSTELFRDPRLLNDGKTLIVGVYSDVSLSYQRGYIYGYAALDLPTGDLCWYETGPYAPLAFLDDTVVLFGNKMVDLAAGTEETVLPQHGCTLAPFDYAVTADFIHYFGCVTPYDGDLSNYLILYCLDEEERERTANSFSEYYPVLDSLNKKGLVTLLLKNESPDWELFGTDPAINDKQCFCTYSYHSAFQWKETILLVTAPKT